MTRLNPPAPAAARPLPAIYRSEQPGPLLASCAVCRGRVLPVGDVAACLMCCRSIITEEHTDHCLDRAARLAAVEAENAALRAALEQAGTDLIGFHGYFERLGSYGTAQSIQRTLDKIDAAYLPERAEWTCGPCVRKECES